ncbi:MAG TPA: VOC family protein [Ktedonobacterales bacterium]|nr:VOC family protein [Ktedonobacterales bacterium]
MPTRVDHVIIAGPDLDALEESFTRMGFHVTGGGEHPHLGTRNRIIILDESYIELLAVAGPDRASTALQRFIAGGGGWIGYALQSSDIAAETATMRARGVDARGPTPGSLVAPDGSARGWRVTMIGSDDIWEAAFPLPFLIQHDTTGQTHRHELAGPGGLAPHPNGASHLMSVRITCLDGIALARRYQNAYSLPGSVTRTEYEGIETASGSLALDSGESIQIVQPPNPAAIPVLAERGAVMTVRLRIGNPRAIEDLNWHSSVATTRTARTLIVRVPGVNAEIEYTASR